MMSLLLYQLLSCIVKSSSVLLVHQTKVFGCEIYVAVRQHNKVNVGRKVELLSDDLMSYQQKSVLVGRQDL